jgi:hypothetical protein
VPILELEVRHDADRYWVAIDDQDVVFSKGKRNLPITSGKHILTLWVKGDPGEKAVVIGKCGALNLFEKAITILPSRDAGAGQKYFTVPE